MKKVVGVTIRLLSMLLLASLEPTTSSQAQISVSSPEDFGGCPSGTVNSGCGCGNPAPDPDCGCGGSPNECGNCFGDLSCLRKETPAPSNTMIPPSTPTPTPVPITCNLTVLRNGPGNYSIYGPYTNKRQTKKIYIVAILVKIKQGDAVLVDSTVRVDPCNRNYSNLWSCAALEGSSHPAVTYRDGRIAWTDSAAVKHELLKEPINGRRQSERSLQSQIYAMYADPYLSSFKSSLKEVSSDFCTVDASSPQVSPVVLDMKGNGVQFTDPSEDFVRFDFGREGIFTSWIANPDDVAFLTLDSNQNGRIDSVDEMFGDRTSITGAGTFSDGFEALAFYDDNKDGAIDAADAVFPKLLLWNDRNHNGASEPSELAKASGLLERLSTKSDKEKYFADPHSSFAFGRATAKLKDGKERFAYDAWFAPGANDLLVPKLAGEQQPLPKEGEKNYRAIADGLQALLKEEGFAPHEASYSTGNALLVRRVNKEFRIIRWPIGPSGECTGQLTFDNEWHLKDRIVFCKPQDTQDN